MINSDLFSNSYSKLVENFSNSRAYFAKILCIFSRYKIDISNEIFALIGVESIHYTAVEQNVYDQNDYRFSLSINVGE